jgi:predicted membrane protein
MDNLIQYLSDNPLIFIAAVFMAFLIIYFIFKQLFKIALLFLLILLAVGGYYYFKDPKSAPEKIKHVLTEVKQKTVSTVEKGKKTYEKGKDFVDKARDLNEGVNKMMGADKEKPPVK